MLAVSRGAIAAEGQHPQSPRGLIIPPIVKACLLGLSRAVFLKRSERMATKEQLERAERLRIPTMLAGFVFILAGAWIASGPGASLIAAGVILVRVTED